jgi:hypothetical protein
MEFVPKAAPLVVLSFLGTTLLIGATALAMIYFLWRGDRARAAKVLICGVVVAASYAGVLLVKSFASKEMELAAGEWKYFCEVDCHLAYSVTGVRTAKTLGSGAHSATAEGTFYVVTLKTWFDPETISASRENGILHPNLRMARIVDESGRRYPTSLEGQKALDAPAAKLVSLDQTLRPGDSYETTLVFDLPNDVRNPRLLLTDPLPVNWLLIGHENSFFHKKVYFAMQPKPAEVSTTMQ